jgi:hypothetical protein
MCLSLQEIEAAKERERKKKKADRYLAKQSLISAPKILEALNRY